MLRWKPPLRRTTLEGWSAQYETIAKPTSVRSPSMMLKRFS